MCFTVHWQICAPGFAWRGSVKHLACLTGSSPAGGFSLDDLPEDHMGRLMAGLNQGWGQAVSPACSASNG